MLKAIPTYDQKFSFIQIASLPFAQQEAFMLWIPTASIQELTINNITLTDCVDYQEYDYWYDFQYQNSTDMLALSF